MLYGMVMFCVSEFGVLSDEDEVERVSVCEGCGVVLKDFVGEFCWDWIVMDEGYALKNATTRFV